MKRGITIALIFLCAALFAANRRVITELDGTRVEIPSLPQRIACLYYPAYTKIIMLGGANRIVMMPNTASPWAKKFYPELRKVDTLTTGVMPDPEKLLKLKVDLVFYPKSIKPTKALQTDIAFVCAFNPGYVPTTIDAHILEMQKQVRFFADVLGADAMIRADKYCAYLKDITSRIKAVTSKIKDSDKPRVYYGTAADIHSSQGGNTIMRWNTELAGGVYLTKNFEMYFAKVTREQLIGYDPDIIMVGMRGFKKTEVTGLSGLRAEKEKRVYFVPSGISYWELTGCEMALLPLYLAKIFHPQLFAGWDIVKEMEKFYFEIYGIKISVADIKRILNSLPPE